MASEQGQFDLAKSLLDEMLQVYRGEDNQHVLAGALRVIGGTIVNFDPKAARRYLEQSRSLAQKLGNRRHFAQAGIPLARILLRQGDYAQARIVAEQSLVVVEKMRLKSWQVILRVILGNIATAEGDLQGARRICQENLPIAREIGDRVSTGMMLAILGGIAIHEGDLGQAQRLLKESLTALEPLEAKRFLIIPIGYLGDLALREADIPRAEAFFKQAMQIARSTQNRVSIPSILERLAQAAVSSDPKRAARLLSAAEAFAKELGIVRNRFEESDHMNTLGQVHAVMDGPRLAKFWEEGKSLNLEQIFNYTLQDQDGANSVEWPSSTTS